MKWIVLNIAMFNIESYWTDINPDLFIALFLSSAERRKNKTYKEKGAHKRKYRVDKRGAKYFISLQRSALNKPIKLKLTKERS